MTDNPSPPNTPTITKNVVIKSLEEYKALTIPEGDQIQVRITPKRRAPDEPSKRPRAKRVRIDDSSSSTNQSSPCALLRYPFLIPLFLEYLNDNDVLLRLLLTGKVMKPSLLNYRVKQWILPSHVATMSKRSQRRYLPVTVVNMRNITKLDLSSQTTIKQVEIMLGPKSVTSIKFGMLPEWLTGIVFKCRPMYEHTAKDRPSCFDLEEGLLPSRLKRLTFDDYFNRPLVANVLSDTLEELEFGRRFNQPVEAHNLPRSIRKLTLGNNFNQPILPGVLPVSLVSLTLGRDFNQQLEPGCLPSALKELDMWTHSNQLLEIGVFPASLRSLKLQGMFSQAIDPGVIPSGVTLLTLDIDFRQPLMPGSLPDTLESLELSYHFNQPIVNVIPRRLRSLTMCFVGVFDQSLAGALPDTVTELILSGQFNQTIEPGTLPSSLLRLQFGAKFNQPLQMGSLPPNLTYLDLGCGFCQPLPPGLIPESVIDLKLFPALAPLFEWSTIPRKVISLRVVTNPDQPLVSGDIPPTVKHLMLTVNKASLLQPGCIPDSVTDLTLRILEDDLPVAGVIPLSVTHLSLSDICKRSGHETVARKLDLTSFIPKSVTHIRFECLPVDVTIPVWITHLSYGLRRLYRRVDMSEIPSIVDSLSPKWFTDKPITTMNITVKETSAEAVAATVQAAEHSSWMQWITEQPAVDEHIGWYGSISFS